MSWKDHRNRITRSQEMFAERQRLIEEQILKNESKGTSLVQTRDQSIATSPEA
jgi:hypothetical protein